MNDNAESAGSPYRPPEADLTNERAAGVISVTAMRLLQSSKGWMRVMAVALMANGVAGAVATVYLSLMARLGVFSLMMLLIGVLISLLIFMPGLRLMQSSLWIARAGRSAAEMDIVRALDRHQQFWRWIGVTVMAIVALVLVAGILNNAHD